MIAATAVNTDSSCGPPRHLPLPQVLYLATPARFSGGELELFEPQVGTTTPCRVVVHSVRRRNVTAQPRSPLLSPQPPSLTLGEMVREVRRQRPRAVVAPSTAAGREHRTRKRATPPCGASDKSISSPSVLLSRRDLVVFRGDAYHRAPRRTFRVSPPTHCLTFASWRALTLRAHRLCSRRRGDARADRRAARAAR